jgi:DNA-binding CsgD family transcriptional regulator
MEQAMGWNRFDVEGRLWSQVCVPGDELSDTMRWIEEALRGALREYETTTVTRTGARMVFHFEFSLVGRGDAQALLVTAKRTAPAPSPLRGLEPGRDLDYDVAIVGADFGQLLRLHADGAIVTLAESDCRCHMVLHGKDTPCDDCPLRATGEEPPWPRSTIRLRRLRRTDRDETFFEITTAELVDEATVRVRLRTLSESTLAAIHHAKLQELATLANLSERERDVMRYLVMGRSIEDIATIFGITARTVKYHQANLLEKVGADSRVDLVRLLL